ncbi:unnamed protein product [Parascedosporium putredinis]|uniref:DnaJ-domain-containing protein n=1 Tax=Parascedosporium putredinis TaxID=1442378 RepID=A0A9P1M9I3_9PEZI|nr:unnamed protein product [Parascedosporium putredinis]CAI7995711.1 unnamed protein product [Parascedosporium putredinis]
MLLKKAAILLFSLAQLALSAEDYYQVLGVSRDAPEKSIKSAYRKLSKKFHPDKNPGDSSAKDKFVEVSEAYEALSDPELRRIYDQYGHDGGPSVELRVAVGLRDFYNGADTEFHWEKQHVCEQCDGTGAADGVVETCPHCHGNGMRIVKRQLAPGMFQQFQSPCDACGQRGKIVKHKCPTCQGQRVIRKATPVDLKIPAAPLRSGRGLFRRRGDDLVWSEVLSLREAWMGDWTRNLTHLDGHVVYLGRKRGEVVQPGQVETVVGEGMPKYHEDGDSVYHKTEFGNLLVEYTVILPDQMISGMEKDFWSIWEKWRASNGIDLQKDGGRPIPESKPSHDEL